MSQAINDSRTPTAHSTSHAPGGSDDIYVNGGNTSPTRIETIRRDQNMSGQGPPNASLHLTYFTAMPASLLVSNFTIRTVAAVSGAVTHAFFGIYTADASGNVTLVAQTDDRTDLAFGATTTLTMAITKNAAGGALANYTLTRGARYALGILFVAGTTPPTFFATSGASAFLSSLSPVLCASNGSGLTALPTSVASGALSASTFMFYVALS